MSMNSIKLQTKIKTMSDDSKLSLHQWTPEQGASAKYAVFIVHGMAEHALRYDSFARFLCENGIPVYAPDLRGHGRLAFDEKTLGFLAEKNGFQRTVLDVQELVKVLKSDFPAAKLVLFGHSFGSFIAQSFIEQFGTETDACILSGTTGPRLALVRAGNIAAWLVKTIKGKRHPSKFLDRLSFGAYLKNIAQADTAFDWLSRNKAEVQKYVNDPLCGFLCTSSFFYDLTAGLMSIHRKKNILGIPADLPIYLFAGTADPVGMYTAAIKKLANIYRSLGIKNLSEKYYEGGRHEMLNEINYAQVQNDILIWIKSLD